MCETNLSTFAISFGFHIYLKVDKKPFLAGDMAKKQGGGQYARRVKVLQTPEIEVMDRIESRARTI